VSLLYFHETNVIGIKMNDLFVGCTGVPVSTDMGYKEVTCFQNREKEFVTLFEERNMTYKKPIKI
jgi:hypothetical protein